VGGWGRESIWETAFLKQSGQYTMIVSDLLGKTIDTQDLYIQQGKNMFNYPVQKLNNGVYQMTFKGQNGQKSVKFTVMH